MRQPEVDETQRPDEEPRTLVRRLALSKLAAVVADHETGVAGDTVVVIGDEMLTKPLHQSRAVEMLQLLSGRTHEVLGGLAICHKGQKISQVIRTRVTFRKLTAEEIDAYSKTNVPLQKAGAYAIQNDAAGFVISTDGCRENVIGLSMPAVLAALRFLDAESAN